MPRKHGAPALTSARKEKHIEKVISSEMIYKGKAVTLRRDIVELPTGRRSTREIMEHPGSVAIVPILDDGRLIFIRQFRLAAGGVIWEIPAGTMERGEEPEASARRELEEETGYRAGKIEHLFKAYPTPGYSTELTHYYLATSLEKSEQSTDEDEIISVEPVRPEKIIRMIRSNEIVDAKSIAAVAYLQASGRI
jgi:ADP-ribose pyrophosphatase